MICIVVPAYNEEKTIGRVVRGLFEQSNRAYGVVVVDDGSNDKTGAEAMVAGAVVLTHAVNRGQGAALETGNEYARMHGATTVVHFDADLQMNPDDIAGAIRLLEEKKLDVVLGSRFLDARSKIPWLKKYILLPIARCVNHLITGVQLTDVHNGFRVLGKRALSTIKITHDGMAHNTEIVSLLKTHNLRYAEYPVEIIYHEYGQGLGGGLKTIWDLFISSL